jgi:hypothetical protein
MHFHKSLILCALAVAVAISASHPVPASCGSVPDTITLNANGKAYLPFSFNHAKHIQDIKECSDCHHHTTGTLVTDANCVRCHANSSPTAVVSCKGCHSATPFSPEVVAEKKAHPQRYHLDKMGLKGAMHTNCLGCHKKQGAGPVGCKECHKRTKAGDALFSSTATPKPGQEKEHE